RLRQLERGRLIPNASLDLHGVAASLVAEKIGHFLQDARYQGWQTLLIVTGRGLHSPTGQTLVRDAAEKYLRQNAEGQVAEWGRAPRSYGGEGALAVFLKQSPPEKNA
ncbi:MAG: DNA mismatch repair protein MutS, partial [Deltaproteobacteria bacterium]|nr:DNA mismatch repair protein MutS [Deltaproteobacteria bacterium]